MRSVMSSARPARLLTSAKLVVLNVNESDFHFHCDNAQQASIEGRQHDAESGVDRCEGGKR